MSLHQQPSLKFRVNMHHSYALRDNKVTTSRIVTTQRYPNVRIFTSYLVALGRQNHTGGRIESYWKGKKSAEEKNKSGKNTEVLQHYRENCRSSGGTGNKEWTEERRKGRQKVTPVGTGTSSGWESGPEERPRGFTPSGAGAHTDTDMDTQRRGHTDTRIHRDTDTDMDTWTHRDIQTQTHRHTQRHGHTDGRGHIHTHACTHSLKCHEGPGPVSKAAQNWVLYPVLVSQSCPQTSFNCPHLLVQEFWLWSGRAAAPRPSKRRTQLEF